MTDIIPANVYPVAQVLDDVPSTAVVEPLVAGDSRYVALEDGHRGEYLGLLRNRLRRAVRHPELPLLKLVLTGHRGCGKTTELLRIEREFGDHFFPIHVELDRSLEADFDYSLMLLWLVQEVARQMEAVGLPLDPRELDGVGLWFAEQTRTVNDSLKTDGMTETTVKAGVNLFDWGVMARLRMRITGSAERRVEIKTQLRNSGEELLLKVNGLLNTARSRLDKAGKPSRILIVQDNLDRLGRDTARALFGASADFLNRIDADCIFTAPIAQSLAPLLLRNQFPDSYPLPTIKTANQDGTPCEEGIRVLASMLRKRVDLDAVFADPQTWQKMCVQSGGSVRDLMRLLGLSAEFAEVLGKTAIDGVALDRATAKLRKDYQAILVPARAYYPRLAKIHCDHTDGLVSDDDLDGAAADKDREHFCHMLINGTVLEYDNGDVWYGVHPLVQQIGEFQKALDSHARQPSV